MRGDGYDHLDCVDLCYELSLRSLVSASLASLGSNVSRENEPSGMIKPGARVEQD